MLLTTLDIIILTSFFALSLGIGLYYRKKAETGLDGFFLGGRNLPWYIAGISMVATTFAADTPLAVTGLVGNNGIAGNWVWWNAMFGGMLTVYFFAKLWRRANILTEVEFIELRYSGKPAAFLRGFKAVYLGLFMNIMVIGWVNLALYKLIKIFFPEIPVENIMFFVFGAMVIAVIYTSISGLWGVAVTDVVQFCIAMVGCIILAYLVLDSEQIGGIAGLKEKLPPETFNFFPSFDGMGYTISLAVFIKFFGIVWWSSWYPGAEPGGGGYIAQRMMSTKNERHSILATILFQIGHFAVRPWPWIIVALCSLVLYPDLTSQMKGDGYVMAMKDYLPSGLRGLLLVSFLAAYLSTISTQLNWGASYLVNDLYKRFLTKKEPSNKKLVLASRVTTLIIMVFSIGATIVIQKIASIEQVWVFIMDCGAGLGLVLILRWYWWRINAWTEIAATIAPFIAFGATKLMGIPSPNSFFITVGFTTIVWIITAFITKPTDNAVITNFYTKVKPGGWWKPLEQSTGIKAANNNMPYLILSWLSSVIMLYSVLFLTGKIIFAEWEAALNYSIVALLSFVSLAYFAKKGKVF